MVRIALHTEDRTLLPLLSSALGKDFQIVLAADDEINRLVGLAACDVIILDLSVKPELVQEQSARFQRIVECRVPCIVMADDVSRSAALNLVKLGAYGYCRRPPSIRDLKTQLLRAHEHFSLKRELRPFNSNWRRLTAATG